MHTSLSCTLHAAMRRTLALVALVGASLLQAATDPAATPSTTPARGNWEATCQWHLQEAHTLRASLAGGTLANTLVLFDRMQMHLTNVMDLTTLLRRTHPEDALREAADTWQKEAQQVIDDLWLDRTLYEAVLMVDPVTFAADPVATHWREKTLATYRHNGVDKDEATRTKIADFRARLTTLHQCFIKNIQEDVRHITLASPSQLEGLPQDYKEKHQPNEQGNITITTAYPDLFPFLRYAEDVGLRRELYYAFRNRGYPANKVVLEEMLQQRHALVCLLGKEDYASYVLEENMAGTKEGVRTFIDEMRSIVDAPAQAIHQAILDYRRTQEPEAATLAAWESGYWSTKYKEAIFGVDPQEVRAYFPSNHVRETLFTLTAELFGVTYVLVHDDPWVWHGDVTVYDVYSKGDDNKPLGRIYLDLYPRQGKYQHACCQSFYRGVAGVQGQTPCTTLIANLPQAGEDEAYVLMEFGQVRTFFHEFGHIMHDIISGQGNWARFAGVYSVPMDYIEVPSMFLERWLATPSILQRVTRHHETGVAMPQELMEKVIHAREWTKALDTQRQLILSDLSFTYHVADPTADDFDLDTIERNCWIHSLIPYPEGTHMWANFLHLKEYTASYYSYTWAEAIGEDVYEAMRGEGLDNPVAYQHYVATLLAPGSSDEAANLVANFLGRPFSNEAYQRRLAGVKDRA